MNTEEFIEKVSNGKIYESDILRFIEDEKHKGVLLHDVEIETIVMYMTRDEGKADRLSKVSSIIRNYLLKVDCLKKRQKEALVDYLTVTDKISWMKKAHSKESYKELADFLGKERADGNIKDIPSKKGGGLFNLAAIEFPAIIDFRNEAERRTQRNAINNAVKKYLGYKCVGINSK